MDTALIVRISAGFLCLVLLFAIIWRRKKRGSAALR